MNQFRIQADSANPVKRIKNEARRRIVNVVGPEWKQQNIQARAAELHLKETRGVITTAEADQLQAILNLWGWVKSVRAASDSLEASMPADYKDDSYWPVAPV